MARGWVSLRISALSFAGIVAGHLAAYLFVEPDPHDRSALLNQTGHGSWSLFVSVALWVTLATLIGAVARGWNRDPSRCSGPAGGLFPRMATLQVGGFLALEFFERLQSHSGAEGFLLEPAVIVGLLLQVLIAFISPRLLEVLVAGAIKLLRAILSQPQRRAAGTWSGIYRSLAAGPVPITARRLRAPPRCL